MGGISKAVGGLLGGGDDGADAAKDASAAQLQSTKEAIKFQKESRDLARGDLKPFRELGERNIDGLESLVTDPNAQKDFITNNPFFEALATKSKDTLFNNAAARGKVGSGGTAEALQNSLLLLGQNLVDNNVNQRENLVGIGQNAAAGTASVAQNTGSAVSNLITQGGNAEAAGIIGAQNAKTNANNNLINTAVGVGGLVELSDRRMKQDINRIGTLDNDLPVYSFRYKDGDEVHIGVMAQEVLEVLPNAVQEIDGLLHVDYGQIFEDLH